MRVTTYYRGEPLLLSTATYRIWNGNWTLRLALERGQVTVVSPMEYLTQSNTEDQSPSYAAATTPYTIHIDVRRPACERKPKEGRRVVLCTTAAYYTHEKTVYEICSENSSLQCYATSNSPLRPGRVDAPVHGGLALAKPELAPIT